MADDKYINNNNPDLNDENEMENDDMNNDSLESGIDDIYMNSIEYQWLKMM